MAAGEADNVEDGQEIGGECHLRDQRQLALQIGGHLVRHAVGIAFIRAVPCLVFKLAHGIPPARRDLVRIFIGQVIHVEAAHAGKLCRVGKRLRGMPPASRHFGRVEDLPFGIARQQCAGRLKLLLLADAGQHIGKRTARRLVIEGVPGRRQQQSLRRRHIGQKGKPCLVPTIAVQRRPRENRTGGDVADSGQIRGMAGIGMARRHHQKRGAGRQP